MATDERLRLTRLHRAWVPHLPGQHYDVRLTAPDGYRAQRSYSVASSPLDEGEVSPYFHDVVVEGDLVEVRGPFASYFVWRGETPAVAGSSTAFVCGSHGFVEAASRLLLGAGLDPQRIRTERFGPSG